MAHSSIALDSPIEVINVTPLNPLISKCQIKVCYVGDQPNRNRSIITEEVARKLANSIPGSPIVGFYNEAIGDFEEHNKQIDIRNGEFKLTDNTRPYGFVDLNAKVWFQDFIDDGNTVHKYLMTEGYLWTGQYPECQRIIDSGKNNESMELHKETLNATWTKDESGKPQFFIINEAIMEKLCILGEDFEPCFEGSTITPVVQFSFDPDFTTQFKSMVEEVKKLLDKGGTQVFTTYAVKVGDSIWNALYNKVNSEYSIASVCEDDGQKYAVLQNKADQKYVRLDFSLTEDNQVVFSEDMKEIDYTPSAEPQFALADVEAFETEFKKKDPEKDPEKKDPKQDPEKDPEKDPDKKDPKSNKGDPEKDPESKGKDPEKDPDKKDPESDNEDKKNKKDKSKSQYSLEEIPEYQTLKVAYSALEEQIGTLKAQLKSLEQFKLETERVKKQDMINKTFYMLSNEDKKDVIDHIDEYSLDDIEAKLSVICVRNKVNFSALEGKDNPLNGPTTYNLGDVNFGDNQTPAWVQAVLKTAETLD